MTVAVTALFLVGVVVLVPAGFWLLPALRDPRALALLRIARWMSVPAGVCLAFAFALPAGPGAGFLAVPWLALAGLGGLATLLDAIAATGDGRLVRPGLHHAAWAALAFLSVAAGNAMVDRLGIQPFGFAPLIVLLTAVHFTFAGFVLVLVGALAHQAGGGRLTAYGVASVIVGIPITAVGFFGVDPAALLGAILVAAGGVAIGLALLRVARSDAAGSVRWLRRLAGTSLLLSMPLAVLYAAGEFLGTTWIDLPTMARSHGVLNALGFAVPAIVALTLERRARRDPWRPAGALETRNRALRAEAEGTSA